MISSRGTWLARPGIPPMWAQEPKATMSLALLAQQLGDVLVLGVADRAVEDREVELAVGHRLDVVVLAVDGDRPEADVGGRGHVEDELVGVEDRHVAAAAGCAPVERDSGASSSATSHLSARSASSAVRTRQGPRARTCSVMSLTMSAKRLPSLALTHSSRTRSGSIP